MDCKSRNYVKIWQKLCEGRKGLSQKVWTRTKSGALTYAFCLDIKICRDLRTFWKTLCKQGLSWVKRSV